MHVAQTASAVLVLFDIQCCDAEVETSPRMHVLGRLEPGDGLLQLRQLQQAGRLLPTRAPLQILGISAGG